MRILPNPPPNPGNRLIKGDYLLQTVLLWRIQPSVCCRVLPQGGAGSSELDFMLNFRAGEARGAAEIVGHGLLTGRGDVTPVDAN